MKNASFVQVSLPLFFFQSGKSKGKPHVLTVCPVVVLCLLLLTVCSGLHASSDTAEAGIHNILDYGAIADGETNNQREIQSAIDACHEAGGGRVLIPPGTYLTGTVFLKDNVTLHLSNGSVLLGSGKEEDFDEEIPAIVAARNAKNIAVNGEGTIRGRGELNRGIRHGSTRDYYLYRSRTMQFVECRDVRLTDFSILFSTRFTVVLNDCDTVFIDRLTIRNNLRHINSDGIDPYNCRNVHISNCHIETGDDSIVLKTGGENIVVSNCTLISSTSGVKFGTGTEGHFRNVHFSNVTIDAPTGIGLYMKDGGTIENVSFNQITIDNPTPETFNRDVTPIFFDIEKRHEDSPVGAIRDITMRDIRIKSGSGVLIQGMPEHPIENLLISNLIFRADRIDSYADRRKPIGGSRSTSDERDTLFARQPTWIAIAYVDGLRLEHVRVYETPEATKAKRTPWEIWKSEGVMIDGQKVHASALPKPVGQQ